MRKVYIFNPDNDLALAYGGENYTAPPLATKLRYDLQMLPVWYADPGSYILSDVPENMEWLSGISEIFPLDLNIIESDKLCNCTTGFSPWGWSADMRKRLIDKGVPPAVLPEKQYIENIRKISHRSVSIKIHNELYKLLGKRLSPVPVEYEKFEKVKDFAVKNPSCFIKAPWSGSGKGIFRVLDTEAVDFKRWASGILSRQGSLMCEVALNKKMDFAMEFCCKNGIAEFAGYSVFENDSHCSFDMGYVMGREHLQQKILSLYKDKSMITGIRESLEEILTREIAPFYDGYLGIDMLVYKNGGAFCINPCVEMNIRMTMGAVTSIIGDSYIGENSSGIFKVEYHKPKVDVVEYAGKLQSEHPLCISDGKVRSGVLFLAPVAAGARYCAYIKVGENSY